MLTENGTADNTTADDDGENTPLGTGWNITSIAIGIFAALIAAGGMILSFRAVSAEMIPAFGTHWAWLVPIVVDLTVLVFSGVDLVLTRHGIAHPIPRVTVYAATFGTIWLNYGAGGNLVGRIAHILMPSIWVMFVETMRHVVRHKANLVGVSLRQPIPAARWILSPWPTAMLWRRMILWQVNSYTLALAHERERLRTIAGLREKHGRLWRLHVSPLVRLELAMGPGATLLPGSTEPPSGTVEPGPSAAPGTAVEPSHGTPAEGSAEPVPEPAMERPTEPKRQVPAPRSAPRANRSRGTAGKRSAGPAMSLVPNPEWPAVVKKIVADRGPDVYLSVIQSALGCSKSTASRLRGEAVTELASGAEQADSEDERAREAS